MSAEKYFYLNQGGSYSIDGKNDKDDFENLQSSMQVWESTFIHWYFYYIKYGHEGERRQNWGVDRAIPL